MAERLRANVFGRYYVTSDCDGCGMCIEIAPLNFTYSWDGHYCALFSQPVDEVENALVRRAMRECPRACVFDDGDEL